MGKTLKANNATGKAISCNEKRASFAIRSMLLKEYHRKHIKKIILLKKIVANVDIPFTAIIDKHSKGVFVDKGSYFIPVIGCHVDGEVWRKEGKNYLYENGTNNIYLIGIVKTGIYDRLESIE
jgi:hypothetical protein